MKFPVASKWAALLAVLLCLMWGLSMVAGLVSERRARQTEAARGVAESTAGAQTLIGPALHRQCTESWEVRSGTGREATSRQESRSVTLTATPSQLRLEGQVDIEARYRGLFRINGYLGRFQWDAQWDDLTALRTPSTATHTRWRCEPVQLTLAVSDARGIRAAVLTLNPGQPGARSLRAEPGTRLAAYPQGWHAVLDEGLRLDQGLTLHGMLDLLGTSTLAVVPLAEQTQVRLRSPWPHPSFEGQFLPQQREVGPQGFSASWQLSALASNAGPMFEAGQALCGDGTAAAPTYRTDAGEVDDSAKTASRGCLQHLGVAFMEPVNPYVLSDRASKYGILFIALTFVAVGLMEVLRQLRVHPVQYLLVGSALVLFFLLLLSLSEHLAFGWAYAAAASACVGLLSFYACHVLQGLRAGLGFGAAMALLYGALYVLLLQEQTALLLGSLLLFVVLAGVMAATRRLDWYALGATRPQPVSAAAAVTADATTR